METVKILSLEFVQAQLEGLKQQKSVSTSELVIELCEDRIKMWNKYLCKDFRIRMTEMKVAQLNAMSRTTQYKVGL